MCRRDFVVGLAILSVWILSTPLSGATFRNSSICIRSVIAAGLGQEVPTLHQMNFGRDQRVAVYNDFVHNSFRRHLPEGAALETLLEPSADGRVPLREMSAEILPALAEEGTFRFQMHANGAIAATSSSLDSDMSDFFWYRDALRKAWILFQEGDVENARLIVLRVLSVASSQESGPDGSPMERLTSSLLDPAALNFNLPTFWTAFNRTPPVRVNVHSGRYEPWSPQVDAYALLVMVSLDMLREGMAKGPEFGLTLNDLSPEMIASILGTLSLLTLAPLEYFKQTGFWENSAQIYTHGLMAALQALEGVQNDLARGATSVVFTLLQSLATSKLEGDLAGIPTDTPEKFLEYIQTKNPTLDTRAFSLKRRILESTTLPRTRQKVDHLYRLVKGRIDQGVEVDAWNNDPKVKRQADLALLMVAFWRKLERLDETHYRKIISMTLPLVGLMGVERFDNPVDDYLHPLTAFEYYRDTVIPPIFLANRENGLTMAGFWNRPENANQPREKVLPQLVKGPFKMQWTLGTPAVGKAYLQMLRWFPETETSRLVEYREGLVKFLLMTYGQLTPGKGETLSRAANQHRAKSLIGTSMSGFQWPEGYIPLGSTYLLSPNSKLYWTLVEAYDLIANVNRDLKWGLQVPRPQRIIW